MRQIPGVEVDSIEVVIDPPDAFQCDNCARVSPWRDSVVVASFHIKDGVRVEEEARYCCLCCSFGHTCDTCPVECGSSAPHPWRECHFEFERGVP